MNGAGTWNLSGANTYTGGTTVSAGTLQIGSPAALGGSTGAVTVTSGAVLDLNGQTMTNTNALTLNGTGISGGGALINSSAANATYPGFLTLGSASSIVSNNGNIIIGNTTSTTTVITGAGFNLTLDGTATGSNITSQISTGTGSVIKNGTGKWDLSCVTTFNSLAATAFNTYTGGTSINAGTLEMDLSGQSSGVPSVGLGSIVITSPGILDLNNDTVATTVYGVTNHSPGVARINGPTPALVTNMTGNGTIITTGLGVVDFWGNGTSVTGISTFTGVIDIQAGVLACQTGAGLMAPAS